MMISGAVKRQESEMEYQNTLAARLCAVVLNANGVTRKDKKPYEIDDFMPSDKKQEFNPELLEEIAKTATLRMGGNVSIKP